MQQAWMFLGPVNTPTSVNAPLLCAFLHLSHASADHKVHDCIVIDMWHVLRQHVVGVKGHVETCVQTVRTASVY